MQVGCTRTSELDGLLMRGEIGLLGGTSGSGFPRTLVCATIRDAGWCGIGQQEPLPETVLGLRRLHILH